MDRITDQYGRSFKTLRISLTDTCNLACSYCTDEADSQITIIKDQLKVQRYLESVAKIHQHNPLEVVRLTGGEPLLFQPIGKLIKGLKELGIPKVKLTTNAVFLRSKAIELLDAGLDEVNISLDAIDPEVFKTVTRKNNLNKVLDGIEAAQDLGIKFKVNAVILKGINDSEILPLFEYAKSLHAPIRFLELMNMGYLYHDKQDRFFSQKEILDRLSEQYNFIPLERTEGSTANYWLTDDLYEFGVIANSSEPFCHDCHRLRMDHNGKIYGCLSSSKGYTLEAMQSKEAVQATLKTALSDKQSLAFKGSKLSMKFIGG